MKKNLILFLGWILFSSQLFSAELKGITLKQEKEKTVLHFSIQGEYSKKSFILSNPYRLVVDFSKVNKVAALNKNALTNRLITQVRIGNPAPEVVRLVFDLTAPITVSPTISNAQGMFLELEEKKLALGVPNNKIRPSQLPQIKHTSPVNIVKNATKLRDVIVVIDAGHGGKDPGAKGPRNNFEKHVVLNIALKLKQFIDKQPGMRAVLTRKGDYYIGLRKRLEIARQYNADIFVSIHADAFINQHSNGASVFALSPSGATSEAARWLAEKENYSELGGVNLSDLDDRNGVVRSVLIDLSQTATIGSSLQMGNRVLRQLGNMTSLHNHRVEQARFMVLKSPDIPSILVETGFISNPREESNLTNNAYQTRLSQSIFQGLKNYFWDYPPHGTLVEAMTAKNRHLVKAGEDLPKIAQRYKVSVSALAALNHLPTNKPLHAGQNLVVPSQWG